MLHEFCEVLLNGERRLCISKPFKVGPSNFILLEGLNDAVLASNIESVINHCSVLLDTASCNIIPTKSVKVLVDDVENDNIAIVNEPGKLRVMWLITQCGFDISKALEVVCSKEFSYEKEPAEYVEELCRSTPNMTLVNKWFDECNLLSPCNENTQKAINFMLNVSRGINIELLALVIEKVDIFYQPIVLSIARVISSENDLTEKTINYLKSGEADLQSLLDSMALVKINKFAKFAGVDCTFEQ